MATVYLGLGSNLGDKEENIQQAIKLIGERIGKIIAQSALYVTDPVGFVSDNDFINSVCEIQTSLSPLDVLRKTEEIEKESGRIYKSCEGKYSDRIIDIDILLYDGLIVENEKLTIPHPSMKERIFVLQPLTEIAPDLIHPTEKQTIKKLYIELLNQ